METADALRKIGYIEGLVKAADVVRKFMTSTSDPRVVYEIMTALREEVNKVGDVDTPK